MPILQLAIDFQVEAEDQAPDLSALCSDIERRLRSLSSCEEAFADVGEATKRFSLVVEITGEVDALEAQAEMVEAVKEAVPKLVEEPRCGRPWILDQEEE